MQPSPLTQAGTWDLVADDYAAEIAPVFETYARAALELSGIGADSRVVDVATGPGTLALLAAEGGAQVEALDFSARMIAQLEARARARRLAALSARVGDGMALPYPDASFDAGFSMFGLMFFPDRARGFAELARVLVPGARAVVSSWLPLDTLPLMKATFSLLTELAIDGSPPPPAPPGGMPMTSPDACRSEMEAGPFGDRRGSRGRRALGLHQCAGDDHVILRQQRAGGADEAAARRTLVRRRSRAGPPADGAVRGGPAAAEHDGVPYGWREALI